MNRASKFSLVRSFAFAFGGIISALKRERNLRIHFVVAVFVLSYSKYYVLSTTDMAVLLLCIGSVIGCELLNSAVEYTVNLHSPTQHHLAGLAKDVAAGAVLFSAIISVCVGVVFFWDIPTFKIIASDTLARPLLPLSLLLLSAVFISKK